MYRDRVRYCLAIACCMAPCTPIFAQKAYEDTGRQNAPGQGSSDKADTRSSQSQGQTIPLEKAIIGKLRKSNDAEIALGQLAQQRSSDPTVKAIAEHMIHDHQEMNQKLEKESLSSMHSHQPGATKGSSESGTAGASDPADLGSGANGKNSGDDAQSRERRSASGLRSNNDDSLSATLPVAYWQLIERTCDNDLTMTRDMLSKHQGKDFDMAYLGQQHVAHVKALAELQAIEELGPSALTQTASQAKIKVNEHLTHITQALESLKSDSPVQGSGSKRSEAAKPSK